MERLYGPVGVHRRRTGDESPSTRSMVRWGKGERRVDGTGTQER